MTGFRADIDIEAVVRAHLEPRRRADRPAALGPEDEESRRARGPAEIFVAPFGVRAGVFGEMGGGRGGRGGRVFRLAGLLLQNRTSWPGATPSFAGGAAHTMPVDRCYLVEVRRESSMAAELSPASPQVRLTRSGLAATASGSSRCVPKQRWAWGRDEENRFWIAFGPHTAVSLEADEVPFGISIYCDLHVLNVEKLLGDVLNRFDVNREAKAADGDPSTIRIHATARVVADQQKQKQHPGIHTVDLEIDAETRVVRRMVVRRVLNGCHSRRSPIPLSRPTRSTRTTTCSRGI